jgi:hypothetical protein
LTKDVAKTGKTKVEVEIPKKLGKRKERIVEEEEDEEEEVFEGRVTRRKTDWDRLAKEKADWHRKEDEWKKSVGTEFGREGDAALGDVECYGVAEGTGEFVGSRRKDWRRGGKVGGCGCSGRCG